MIAFQQTSQDIDPSVEKIEELKRSGHDDIQIAMYTRGYREAMQDASRSDERWRSDPMPKFEKTYCSNCGGEFGPGDHGFSHCFSHLSADDQIAYLHESLEEGATADDVKNLASLSRGNDDVIFAFAEAWFNNPSREEIEL